MSEDSPCARLYLKPQSWQKDKLQTKMPHLQEEFLQLLKILKQGKQSQRDQLQSISSTQNFSAVLSTCHNSLHSREKYCENPLRVKIKRKRKGHREQEGQKDIKMCISLVSYRALSQVQAWWSLPEMLFFQMWKSRMKHLFRGGRAMSGFCYRYFIFLWVKAEKEALIPVTYSSYPSLGTDMDTSYHNLLLKGKMGWD